MPSSQADRTNPRSDAWLNWAALGWFARALGWCLLAHLLMPLRHAFDASAQEADRAMRYAETYLERRAAVKHVHR